MRILLNDNIKMLLCFFRKGLLFSIEVFATFLCAFVLGFEIRSMGWLGEGLEGSVAVVL